MRKSFLLYQEMLECSQIFQSYEYVHMRNFLVIYDFAPKKYPLNFPFVFTGDILGKETVARNYATVFLLNKQLCRGHIKKDLELIRSMEYRCVEWLSERSPNVALLVVLPIRQLKQVGCYLPRRKKKHREKGKGKGERKMAFCFLCFEQHQRVVGFF
jgi:hypothetical protein